MKLDLRKFLSLTLILFLVFLLNACSESPKSETGISSLEVEDLSGKEFYADVNHGQYELKVISSKDYSEESIRVVVEDPSVLNVTYDYVDSLLFTGFKFDINCLKSGETSFYFETNDSIIKSDSIQITVQSNVTEITLKETEEITFSDWQYEETISFEYKSAHYITEKESAFVFISENPDVVTFEYDKEGSWLSDYGVITPVNPGETYIYIQTKDGSVQSQKLKVIVPNKETDSYDDSDDYYENEEEEQDNSRTVYVTPSGKKYHYSKSCAGKNASETTESSAKVSRDPCKKCAQ